MMITSPNCRRVKWKEKVHTKIKDFGIIKDDSSYLFVLFKDASSSENAANHHTMPEESYRSTYS